MTRLDEAVLEHIGAQGEDGFPERQGDWLAWKCHGCGDELRAPEVPEASDYSSVIAYIQAKACSKCSPGLVSKHLPRSEILLISGVPQHERGIAWDPEKARNPGERHLPRDSTRPKVALEEWPIEGEIRHSIVLTGKNGVGKSMLATQLLVQAFRAGHRSLGWFSCGELVAEHFQLAKWEEKHKAERAKRCGCLVLDEYGRGQHSNPFAYALIGGIIDARKHSLTIITSNLAFADGGDGKSFEETDSAVFDRLTEGLVIPMTGRSQRGRR